MDRGAWQTPIHGIAELDMTEQLTHTHWEPHALEEGVATHSSILPWRLPMDRGAWRATVHGVAKSWIQLSD